MLTTKEILAQIEDQGGLELGPVKLTLGLSSITTAEVPGDVPIATVNFQTYVSGKDFFFASSISAISTPKALQATIDNAIAIDKAKRRELRFPDRIYLPLVIAPYLSADRLDELHEQKCCGVDLCGNGVIVAEGVLIYRTGKPNRYPNTAEIRNVYRRKSALIPQAFMLQPT